MLRDKKNRNGDRKNRNGDRKNRNGDRRDSHRMGRATKTKT